MIFWDSSALAPLLVAESDSAEREAQLRFDPRMLVWYGTRAEIESAVMRRKREGLLDAAAESLARKRLSFLEKAWVEVAPTTQVRDRALRLLRTHPLRASDAFQLAAALVACAERTTGWHFRTGDLRLRSAAEAEGFIVD